MASFASFLALGEAVRPGFGRNGERERDSEKELDDGHGHKSFAREFFIIFLCALFFLLSRWIPTTDCREIYCQCHLGFVSPFLNTRRRRWDATTVGIERAGGGYFLQEKDLGSGARWTEF